jgi:hypothetical protein
LTILAPAPIAAAAHSIIGLVGMDIRGLSPDYDPWEISKFME